MQIPARGFPCATHPVLRRSDADRDRVLPKAPNRSLQSAEHTEMIKGDAKGLTGDKS